MTSRDIQMEKKDIDQKGEGAFQWIFPQRKRVRKKSNLAVQP